jgi:molybdopterin/thiamine biosynthesis adenylyltransferase
LDTIRDIHHEMVARNFVRNRRDTTAIRYEGTFDVRGNSVSAAVVFPGPNLADLPQLYLTNRVRDLPGAIAHVEGNDRICYAREEELVLDPLRPRQAVALCVLKMKNALERIALDDLPDEVSREFPQHWQGSRVYVDLPANAAKAFIYPVPRGEGAIQVIAPSVAHLKRLGLTPKQITRSDSERLEVLLFHTEQELGFTRRTRLPQKLDQLLVWLESVDAQFPARLVGGVGKAWQRGCYFLVRAPNGDVGGSLVIPRILAKSVQRPQFLARELKKKASIIEVSRLSGSRIDQSFIHRRNMAEKPNLSGKRIAVVGVGTIGGWLAKFLAQSGAGTSGGRLVLYDRQSMEPGNLGRHWLGLPYVGQNKAIAAKEELSRTDPDCQVTAVPAGALDHLHSLLDCDLVIDATGEQAFSDVLNRDLVLARNEGDTSAVCLHVWLVGSGVAAQAVLVDEPGHACFRCLRIEDGMPRFRLLNPNHPVALTPANCGEGAFFAYGVGAPAVAAGLAVQMCLDWVRGSPSPRYRTIRLNQDVTFAVKDSDATALERCPACRST